MGVIDFNKQAQYYAAALTNQNFMVQQMERAGRNPEVLAHANRIFPQIRDLREEVRTEIIERVFTDGGITQDFVPGSIRHTAMCGNVVAELLERMEEDPVHLLSIGDVKFPEFAKPAIRSIKARKQAEEAQMDEAGLTGYDLPAKGLERARSDLLGYFDKHYGFSRYNGLLETLTTNSAITPGGMRTLKDIADTIAIKSLKEGKVARFIHPDNSFSTWKQIVGDTKEGRNVEAYELPTEQKDRLHLSPQTVKDFYREHPADRESQNRDNWYITPVGNPSGTAMTPEQLKETCRAILAGNPKAVILLDCVYVRTLPEEKAQALMGAVLEEEAILQRCIFVESLSKSHGMCGARVGMYFAADTGVFKPLQQTIMSYSAGPGWDKSALALAIANCTPKEEQAIRELHQFWAKERRGLYNYLIVRKNFTDIFDEDQSHIDPHELNDPLGLYLFLKLKKGVSGKDILIKTGCLGVKTEMGSNTYMRFSVGTITEATYSKYADN